MAERGGAAEVVERQSQVELIGIEKAFGPTRVLIGLDLSVARGEFLSLLGPSGCGKSTCLNVVAGFLWPDAGEIRLAGSSVVDLPPHRRGLGMVFQRYTLFPHMNVFDNVAFGLRLRRVSSAEVTRRVTSALELVRLPEMGARFPNEMSGGQQQRIALARALVVEPTVLLLDEPLSNLDAKLRREMQVELRRIHEALGTTTIYVTHDQEEALVLSDRIAVMHEGRLAQVDVPRAIYDTPRTRFVAEFVGESNFFLGTVLDRRPGTVRVRARGVEFTVQTNGARRPPDVGSQIELVLREEKVRLASEAGEPNAVAATVVRVVYHGMAWRYFLQIGDAELRALVPASIGRHYEPGDSVFAILPPTELIILEPSPDQGPAHEG